MAPVPSRRSVAEYGADGGAGVFEGEFSPPPLHADAVMSIAATSAMRTGTVNNVRPNTITAGVRLISASIRIPYGITARVAQTDSHARNRAHPARSLMKWVLLAAPNRSGCAEVVKDALVTTVNRK